jgi:hypothetical protein
MNKDTALTQAENVGLALPPNLEEVTDIIRENLGGEAINVLSLERRKIPSGGGMFFTVVGIDGKETPREELQGIVVAHRKIRLRWEKGLDQGGGNQPPDCVSNDGQLGQGSPGGPCALCPLARFGSDPKGNRGKACKEIRQLLVLTPESALPFVLNLPPTSLSAWESYALALGGQRHRFWSVVTAISLAKQKNADSIEYAQAHIRMVRELTEAEREQVAPYVQGMKDVLGRAAPVAQEDYSSIGDTPIQAAATDDAPVG